MADDDLGISAQIACIRRELALRERVYPAQIARGKMKRAAAEYEFRAMRAVLRTLERAQADG
jgi:hypothetical protein